jgi:hypothetical protein
VLGSDVCSGLPMAEKWLDVCALLVAGLRLGGVA